jgi:hypothetical protein
MLKKILCFTAIIATTYFVACKKTNADETLTEPVQLTSEKQILNINFATYKFETTQATIVDNNYLKSVNNGFALSPIIALKPFETSAPFVSVYGVFNGDKLDAQNVTIQFEGSADAKNWSEFIDVKPNIDADATSNRLVFGNVELDAETKYVRFKINFLNNLANIKNADIYLLNPQKTSAAEQAILKAESDKITNEIAVMRTGLTENNAVTNPALCAKPNFTTRATWRARSSRSTPSKTTVNFLCVHHEAGSNSSTDWAARVRAVQNLHMDVNGWSDIGYNYLVDPNGVTYEGRGGGENVIGAHLCGKNTNTMGVCMLGTYTSVRPTNNAEYALKRILAWKVVQRGLNPLGTGFHVDRTINVISGHRASCSTDCPGTALFNDLGRLRTDINTNFVSKCR